MILSSNADCLSQREHLFALPEQGVAKKSRRGTVFSRRASATTRSRRESNPHLRFRKPPFYPLNYGNLFRGQISDIRGQISNLDCGEHVQLVKIFQFLQTYENAP